MQEAWHATEPDCFVHGTTARVSCTSKQIRLGALPASYCLKHAVCKCRVAVFQLTIHVKIGTLRHVQVPGYVTCACAHHRYHKDTSAQLKQVHRQNTVPTFRERRAGLLGVLLPESASYKIRSSCKWMAFAAPSSSPIHARLCVVHQPACNHIAYVRSQTSSYGKSHRNKYARSAAIASTVDK